MEQTEPAVFTNMCMITNEKGQVLVQDRTDPKWFGLSFPGGHVEKNEPFLKSVIREVEEETGLRIRDVRLAGVRQYTHPEFGYRYVVFFYRTSSFSGELHSSIEGRVFWCDRDKLFSYRTVPNLHEIIKVFEDDTIQESVSTYDAASGRWTYENL